MYQTIKNVISSTRYELGDMLTKIDTIWIQGDLTDEQRTELVTLAQENAQPENSYAPLQEQFEQAFAQISALDARVKVLEAGETPEPEPEPEEYPPYVQPSGAHDAYHNGDKISWNGKNYVCIAPENTACVWNPDTYPAYWEEVTA